MDSVERRYWSKVLVGDGCWLWQGALRPDGYGTFWNGERTMPAHRFAYELLVAPVAPELVIDHLCRNRACQRAYDHMEPVTDRVNVLRGIGPTAIHARKTHCPAGHPYSVANTYNDPDGSRDCRICRLERVRRFRRNH